MMGLRTREGVRQARIERLVEGAQERAQRVRAALSDLRARGWIREQRGAWSPTPEGYLFADSIGSAVLAAV